MALSLEQYRSLLASKMKSQPQKTTVILTEAKSELIKKGYSDSAREDFFEELGRLLKEQSEPATLNNYQTFLAMRAELLQPTDQIPPEQD